MTESRGSAYVEGLRMLARRELSEAQLRQRLARRGHAPDAIDDALVRLIAERAVDDRRVAEAIARSETHLKGRGRHRVRRQIESVGISPAIARQAIEVVFQDVDDDALLEAALNKRLRGHDGIADEREAQRLYRALLGQGFDSDRIVRVLATRRRKHD